MSTLIYSDIDFDSVGRIKNALDGIDPMDYITLTQLLKSDYHSGVSTVDDGDFLLIRNGRQMLSFIQFSLVGELQLEGDLCLA